MFLEVEISGNVFLPPSELDKQGLILHRSIIFHLLEDIARKKATQDHGYFVAVTTLNQVNNGRIREDEGNVRFPVTYNCITFKPFKGEILEGNVKQIMKHGVFMSCGPVDTVFIAAQKMEDYQYVAGDSPMFISQRRPKIEIGSIIRFMVLGTKWVETERAFQVLGSLSGDFLGPVR
ncbi:hypothetical protein QJS10_CPA01g01516 [Acorus calamus]|uniref:DNA-directed RNA polymerase subunit n=1 Tax=Acorus calamus TaxID=4465 RepID=A0AAV9FFS8_ACOCL|nr:hypothetical protein QJS10_CPA01g01516 [Acorus calamus]